MILFGKEFSRAPRKCAACAAKDQTIVLMADVIEWHRAQLTAEQLALRSTPAAAPTPFFRPVESDTRGLWATDEEEEITSALESGAIDTSAAERALAAIQARNTHIELVK
jgi:hypothetical protein